MGCIYIERETESEHRRQRENDREIKRERHRDRGGTERETD